MPSSALRVPFWFDLGVCFCFMFLWGVIRLLFATSLGHGCVLQPVEWSAWQWGRWWGEAEEGGGVNWNY